MQKLLRQHCGSWTDVRGVNGMLSIIKMAIQMQRNACCMTTVSTDMTSEVTGRVDWRLYSSQDTGKTHPHNGDISMC